MSAFPLSQPSPARGEGATASDRHYAEQLGAVLRQRDPEDLRAFLQASARAFGDDAQVAQIAERTPGEMAALMHQITLARPDLVDLHRESQAWLDLHLPQHPRPDRQAARRASSLAPARGGEGEGEGASGALGAKIVGGTAPHPNPLPRGERGGGRRPPLSPGPAGR